MRRKKPKFLGLRQVKPVAPLAVLDLDNPEIGIESSFADEAFFDVGSLYPFLFMSARPQALNAVPGEL